MRGCGLVYLDTFTFQAPEFYRRLGYGTLCTIEGFPDQEAVLSVFDPASTTARSRAGTLTTVARMVIAQSSGPALPSATCERSL